MAKQKKDIREKILDVAEKVFAESGFEGASIRAIVNAAKVNLAAVYYYFDSKEGLMAAVLDRRFGYLYKEQREQLKKIQESPQDYTLEQIIEAMISTPLKVADKDISSGKIQIVRKLIGRMVTEPNRTIQEMLRRRHKELRDGFINLIHKKVPHLTMVDLQWRIEFIWGALAFLMCNPQKLEYMSGSVCNPADTETALKQMVQFFCAGLRAPSVSDFKQIKSLNG